MAEFAEAPRVVGRPGELSGSQAVPSSSAARGPVGGLLARALDLGGEELLDLVELHTSLCEGVGGDHGVAPGTLLGNDRPANGGGNKGRRCVHVVLPESAFPTTVGESGVDVVTSV